MDMGLCMGMGIGMAWYGVMWRLNMEGLLSSYPGFVLAFSFLRLGSEMNGEVSTLQSSSLTGARLIFACILVLNKQAMDGHLVLDRLLALDGSPDTGTEGLTL